MDTVLIFIAVAGLILFWGEQRYYAAPIVIGTLLLVTLRECALAIIRKVDPSFEMSRKWVALRGIIDFWLVCFGIFCFLYAMYVWSELMSAYE